MPQLRTVTAVVPSFAIVVGLALPLNAYAAPEVTSPPALAGVWRGTSTCSDRVAAPGCHDEVVVYEFTPGAQPGTVHWKADKIVDGERGTMGEMDLAYDAGAACWKTEFKNARVHMVWCLKVDGAHMTGTGRQLPGNETVRKIDLRKD